MLSRVVRMNEERERDNKTLFSCQVKFLAVGPKPLGSGSVFGHQNYLK